LAAWTGYPTGKQGRNVPRVKEPQGAEGSPLLDRCHTCNFVVQHLSCNKVAVCNYAYRTLQHCRKQELTSQRSAIPGQNGTEWDSVQKRCATVKKVA